MAFIKYTYGKVNFRIVDKSKIKVNKEWLKHRKSGLKPEVTVM